MRRILLLALLYFTGQANAQSTRACFIEEESGAAATGARVEVFENGLLLGMQDLGGLNCFDLGIIIALEAEEVPGAEIALQTYPTVGDGRFTSEVTTAKQTNGRLALYSIDGRLLSQSGNLHLGAGRHLFEIQAGNLAAGSYFIVFENEQGSSATQVFLTGRSRGLTSIRKLGSIGPSSSPIQQNTVAGNVAAKTGGFEYTMRVTRYGSRQKEFAINRGQDLTVTLESARRLTIDARLATNHHTHLVDSNPGMLRVEDIRSGLTHEIDYDGATTAIQLLSDSVRVNYVAEGIELGMQAIRDNPDGTPRRTMTASFNHNIPGTLFLPADQYDIEESHAFLFAIPETFDHDLYFDELLKTLFIRQDPLEGAPHKSVGLAGNEYRQDGETDPNKISWKYSFLNAAPNVLDFSFEDKDIVRDLLANNVPDLFSNSIYEVEFVELPGSETPQLPDHILNISHGEVISEPNYWHWVSYGVITQHNVIMPALVPWTSDMFLHTFANSMWSGKDIRDPIDKVEQGTTTFTESAREIMAVNHAYGPIGSGWDPARSEFGKYFYFVDPTTGNIQGVYMSIFWDAPGKTARISHRDRSLLPDPTRRGAGAGLSRE